MSDRELPTRGMLRQQWALFTGEREAIEMALEAGRTYGYGNVMAWLATEWACILLRHGLSEEAAIMAVSNRTPYLPLPQEAPDIPFDDPPDPGRGWPDVEGGPDAK